MSGTYEYDPSKKLIKVQVGETLTTEEIKAHIRKFLNPKIDPKGVIEIIDMSDVENIVLCYSDIVEIRDLARKLRERGFEVVILYASGERGRDILNMLVPIYQQMKPTLYVCHSEEEALNYYETLSRQVNGGENENSQSV